MKRTALMAVLAMAALGLTLTGCPGGGGGPGGGGAGGGGEPAPAGVPSFSLAWSEYPSWSTFGVAHEEGLVDP